MSKSTLISAVVNAVAWLFLCYLFYGVLELTNGYMTEGGMAVSKEMPDMLHMIIGFLIMGLAFAMIYGKWARGIHSASHGMRFGLLVALFLVGMNFVWFSTSTMMTFTGVLVECVLGVIMYGVAGVLTSLVFGRLGDQ
jgi:hypothetical protein